MTIVETIAVASKRNEDDICSLIVANANVLCSNSEKEKVHFEEFESPSFGKSIVKRNVKNFTVCINNK